MNKKVVTGIAGLLVLAFILYQFFSSDSGSAGNDYLVKDSRSISLSDIRNTLQKADFTGRKAKDYFSGEVVNSYTLRYFKFIQRKFSKEKNLSQEEAEQLYELYRKFVAYEDALAKKMKTWMSDPGAGSSLDVLRRMHQYQMEIFGEETALKLFGADIKAREYPLRRKHIIVDDSLYGHEKEERINKLNRDMWGDDANSIEARVKPVDRYREKMDIYSKDLGEMNAEEKAEKIRQFREELFTPEIVERLEKVDALLVARKEREARYRDEEQAVVNDPNLSEEEKKEKLAELQNRIFGEDAEAFRRREALTRGKR